MMTTPKLIFFDAGGTLFEVRGSVGEIYSRFARRFGLDIGEAVLQQRFGAAFRAQPPLAFPGVEAEAELLRREYKWWRNLVWRVFAAWEFPRFDECFAELFEHFRHVEAWRLYDDVVPTLSALRERGVRLAVLSNFDARLIDLLRGFALDDFFADVHLSARLGAAKPEGRIFQAALRAHGLQPHEVWHVGDSVREDVEGARNVGITGCLIDRVGNSDAEGIRRLDQLVELLP